ncbi:efflux transporter periplasmic adaptor subunit, partial [Bacteroidales bacterium OttesenSCG-928-A17]|nr:efflux transporter periplasmic adaptor subunit [Bacteroidales bacterium OttesenSCG-928-A17]
RQFAVDLVFTGEQIENIRIGKSYRVQIELEQAEEALVVKRGNFFQSTGGQWVFKLNDSGTKAVRVPIAIGRQNPKQYEVLDGLKPGDQIVITGYDNFGDAQEIILK